WQQHVPWGKRRLAYEIGHKDEGIYHLLTFDAAPDTVEEIGRVLRIDDDVMRHMAVRRVEGSSTAAPAVLTPEPVAAPEPDPELRTTPGGTSVCKLRLAVNSRTKGADGQWADKPNYFDVTVWGNQAESCAQYLSKGRPVGVDGRLDWREWDAQDGTKRQAVEIIADSVQFLGSRDSAGMGEPQFVPAAATAATDTADFGAGGVDDDIPF